MITALLLSASDRMQAVRQSRLVMNALYLMLTTFVLAASGFVFWAVVARTYPAEAVGLATTLLSISGLLALLGLVGFDSAMVRFLPGLAQKNEYINSSFIFVGMASIVLAAGIGLVLPGLSAGLATLRDPVVLTGFVFFTATNSLTILTGAVFLAFRHVRYTFLVTSLFCVVKVALPLIIAKGSAATIFMLAGSAQLVGLVLSLVWMYRKLHCRFSFSLDTTTLRTARKFSLSMYAANMLNLLPPTLLPLIILHFTAAQNAAYYYMAFTVATALYTVAYASMQSVFAEGSHDSASLRSHMGKAAKMVAVLLFPAALLTYFLSSLLLGVFGAEYAQSGTRLLQLFVLGALPVAVYSGLGVIFKVIKHLRAMLVMNLVYAAVILGVSYWLVPRLGIMAVGWAWLTGNVAACTVGVMFVMKYIQQRR